MKITFTVKKIKISRSNVERKHDVTKNTAHYKLLSFSTTDFVCKPRYIDR